MVMITVVLACAPIGFMDCIETGGVGVNVKVAVGDRVGDAVAAMVVDVGVLVAITVVGEATMAVVVGNGVSVTGVMVGIGVAEEIRVDTGVVNIGAPTSLQPRSGAAPANTAIGLGGTNSPLLAVYCVTPLSMAGESARRTRPLKSSSTVAHVPSGPAFGAASKSGSTSNIMPAPKLL